MPGGDWPRNFQGSDEPEVPEKVLWFQVVSGMQGVVAMLTFVPAETPSEADPYLCFPGPVRDRCLTVTVMGKLCW